MSLTNKQKRFVEEYLVDLNASAAARRAGYSEKTAGQIGEENLKKPEIAKAIQEAQEARSRRTAITQDMVLQELAKIGFADIRKAVQWGNTVAVPVEYGEGDKCADNGEPVKVRTDIALFASNEIDDATAAAIAEIRQTKEGLAIKMHDKKGALVDIGRHLGMFKDKIELSGGLRKAEELSDDELAALAAGSSKGASKT